MKQFLKSTHRLAIIWVTLLGIMLGYPRTGQAQIPPRLKQFLESRNFMELIEAYKQEKIAIVSKGNRIKREEARPFVIGNGFRCQVFAGALKNNAEQIAEQLRKLNMDSVYVIETPSHLYKVQIGNFTTRRDAEIFLDRLRNAGVTDAWIVEADIHIPKDEPRPPAAEEPTPASEQELSQSLYFTIQVFATNDSVKASRLKEKLQSQFDQPAVVAGQGSVWKVLVGKFTDRASAETFLQELRKRKFEDAWITQVAGTSE